MRRWQQTLGLALALAACDDGPAPDQPDRDQAVADLGLATDARIDPDEGAPPDAGPDAAPPDLGCEPLPPIDSPARGVLADAVLRPAVSLGGPPAPSALRAADLDGDGELEVAVLRGGRVAVFGADGRARWTSPVIDAQRLAGFADLDGDNRPEVVAVTARTAMVFDGLTGAQVFRLDEHHPAFDRLTTVATIDVDLDGRHDLYVTDQGCALEGTGDGRLFRFEAGVAEAPSAVAVTGERINGRCTRWHSFADLDGDALPDLLVNDARGLNRFDPRTGARVWCGDIPGVDTGAIPHQALDAWPERPGAEVLAVVPGAAHLLAPSDEVRDDCPGLPTLRPAWTAPGAWSASAGGLVQLDAPAIALTEAVGPGWRTVLLDPEDGAPVATLAQTELLTLADLDADGAAELVVRRPDPTGAYTLLEVLRWRDGAFESVLAAPLPHATPLWLDANRADARATSELARPAVLRVPGGAALAVVQDADADGTPDQLRLVGAAEASRPLAGAVGAAWITCDPAACAARDVLALALVTGGIAVLDGALALRNDAGDGAPALNAATGRVALAIAHEDADHARLVARATNGLVGVLDLEAPDAPLRWSVDVGSAFRAFGPPAVVPARDDAEPLLVMPSGKVGPTGWLALSLETGAEVWRHGVDPNTLLSRGFGALVDTPAGPSLIRFDRGLGLPIAPLEGCPVRQVGDPETPSARCPESPVLLRSLIALDAHTGQCRWQTLLRPHDNCTGPGNQALSVADVDGDGQPELYLTETNALRRFDAETGALTGTADLGYVPGGAGRGGGWVIPGGDGLAIRFGGNGPLDVFDADLALVWRAEAPVDLRLQSWTGRRAVVAGDEVWVSPGTGRPLDRYPLDGPPRVGRLGLAEGAVDPEPAPEARLADVAQLGWRPLGRDGGDALLVTTDEPWLYALDAHGALQWRRQFDALPDLPLVGDVDQDGLPEVVVPLADGQVWVGDAPGPAAPPEVIDRPCPVAPLCTNQEQRDLEQTELLDQLCAAWQPVADARGYEVRAVTTTGAALTPWIDTTSPAIALTDLRLVPGARYAVEVRTWRDGAAGGRERSAAVTSSGVRVLDRTPPTLSLRVEPSQTPVGAGADFIVSAQDDDRITGRRLEILDVTNRVVWVAPLGAAGGAAWAERVSWPGLDQAGAPVPPGAYRVLARAEDRGRNAASAEVALTVCEGPCP